MREEREVRDEEEGERYLEIAMNMEMERERKRVAELRNCASNAAAGVVL